MTYSASWASPGRIRNRLVEAVARLPARVQTKLLIAFLTIVGLLIVLGAVGLQVVDGVNNRTVELIKLQRKIAAYHQVQHDTASQLYNISTALLLQDDKMLDAALRQLSQFGYDLDRMEFVAKDEAALLAEVRKDYDRFTQIVTRSVELIRSGRTDQARDLQAAQIVPLADHLERVTNQLVNIAEADMISGIDASGRTYRNSRLIVIVFALVSTLLALGLGYVISWSLIGPVKSMEVRLHQIAGGEFAGQVNVINRDELGVLAANVNQTSEQLGRLYQEIEARTQELRTSLEELKSAQNRLIQTEKLASLGQLTAGIAHEIKNPLNFVNNFSAVSVELIEEMREVLASADLDSQRNKEIGELMSMLSGNLQKVVEHGKRADSIVKNMLLHSRQGSGEHRLADINALLDESINLAYHGARAEKPGFNITFEKSFDPKAGEVDLFPQEITRAFLNLISNGFYATTKRNNSRSDATYEPTLTLATKNLGSQVEIRIRDNGTGIQPEVREKIFNPFFTTKPAGEGTGLGLSLSYDIVVKQHAGSIDVDSLPGQYTEFKIILPRTAASLAQSGGSS